MNFSSALDVLAGVAPDILNINDATNLLQSAEAFPMVLNTAFNLEESSGRREVAFVLLRSRIITRQNANNADGVDELVACALDEMNDLNLLRYVGSIISVVWRSISKEQLDANWQKSSEKVYGLFVLAASPAATPDIVIKACTLVSAIYEDVLPDHFNGLISRVNDVISAGFRHEVTTPFALKAVRAIVDSYGGLDNPSEDLTNIFQNVLSHSVRLIEQSVWDRVNEVFKSIVNVCSDANNSWWTRVNLDLLVEILTMCQYDRVISIQGPQIIDNVLCIAGSAFTKNQVTKNVWKYCVDHLAMEYPEHMVHDIISRWEFTIETTSDDDIVVEGEDTAAVAYEQIDRFIRDVDSSTWKKLIKPTIDSLISSPRPQSIYAAWMILASSVANNSTNNMLDYSDIQHYLHRIKLDIPRDFYQSRIMYAVLTFLFNAFHAFGRSCFAPEYSNLSSQCLRSIVEFTTAVPIPRLKAKGLLLYYQFVSVVISEKDDFFEILDSSLNTWLVRDLENPWLLSNCSLSFSNKVLDVNDPEVVQLESHIRELTISAVAGTISVIPNQDLNNFFNYALNTLQLATSDPKADALVEACLDLAARCLEDPVSTAIFDENAPKLLNIILSFDDLLKTNAQFRTRSKYGIQSQSFERSLLEAMSRVANAAEHNPNIILPYVRSILVGTVLSKLQISDVIKISDTLPIVHGTGNTNTDLGATLVVKLGGSTSKTVNVNMSVIEDQIASLTFIGSITDPCWNLIDPQDQFTVFSACQNITMTSPVSFVRKAGMDALKSICETLEEQFARIAENIPGLKEDPRLPSPAPFLEHQTFTQAVTNYLKALKITIQTGTEILKKSRTEIDEDDHIIYALADSCNGLKRLRNYFGCSLDNISDVFPNCAEFPLDHLYSKLMESLNNATKNEGPKADDDDDDDDGDASSANEDVFGIRCDAVMQLISRLAKGCGNIVTLPFCTYLRSFYATILTTNDISIVARTAAICVFANYIEAIGATPSVPNTELLLVALLYCRSLPLAPNKAAELRAKLPQLSSGRPEPKDISNIDENDDDLQFSADEAIKLQAACYCVGVALAWTDSMESILSNIVQVDEVFVALLEHPAAAIPSRRSILDCLACAVVRTMAMLPQSMREPLAKLNLKIFCDEGFLGILQVLFPLDDDHEDASVAHDILIRYACNGTLGIMPPLFNDQENLLANPKFIYAVKTQLLRIFIEAEANPEFNEIVSFSGRGRIGVAKNAVFCG